MDSDDKDAKEPRKKESIHRRVASIIKRAIKKEQTTDSGDISEKIEESESRFTNPYFTKSRVDDSITLLPAISELMTKVYAVKSFGDDNDNFVLETLKEILAEKNYFHAQEKFVQDKSEAKETDSKPEEVRPPLYVNLELDSILHLASYNETLFPTHHKEDPTLTGAGLRNLGSTCYVNSVLQCLVHTVPLYEAILSENHSLKCTCERAILKGLCLSCYICHIFRSSTSGRSVIAPIALTNSLKCINL